eukprot:1346467-Amorphochlora_amoeboformis.AAC.1
MIFGSSCTLAIQKVRLPGAKGAVSLVVYKPPVNRLAKASGAPGTATVTRKISKGGRRSPRILRMYVKVRKQGFSVRCRTPEKYEKHPSRTKHEKSKLSLCVQPEEALVKK